MPQGSILGVLLFNVPTDDLEDKEIDERGFVDTTAESDETNVSAVHHESLPGISNIWSDHDLLGWSSSVDHYSGDTVSSNIIHISGRSTSLNHEERLSFLPTPPIPPSRRLAAFPLNPHTQEFVPGLRWCPSADKLDAATKLLAGCQSGVLDKAGGLPPFVSDMITAYSEQPTGGPPWESSSSRLDPTAALLGGLDSGVLDEIGGPVPIASNMSLAYSFPPAADSRLDPLAAVFVPRVG